QITGSATSTSGPGTMSAKDALDEIRERVGMPEVPADGGPDRTFMERIQHERLVELAFEGQRFFDVRRWGLADDVLNGPIHGLRYEDENGDMQQVAFDPFERSFDPNRDYLWPVPQKEIDLLDLEQNPGY
ncbi:MAG: RagB/SusD family nutrient uptake outer membrane protein, partial [Salinivenus sp.]